MQQTNYKIRDFFDIVSKSVTGVDASCYDRFIGLEHYDSGEPIIQRYSGTSLIESSCKEFKSGDLLIARRNVYLKRAGLTTFDGITSGDSIILRIKESCEIDTGYTMSEALTVLPWIVNSNHFWIYANKHADGMNSKRISKDMILDYEFTLMDKSSQLQLANKAWAAYRLKESYKKLLKASREMVKSQFIEMFKGCNKRVELLTLCDTFIDGDWIESKDQADYGIRLLQTGNVGEGSFKGKDDKSRYISEETYNKLNCTEVFAGDILISRLPDPVGRGCIVPEGLGKAITAVDCTIIRLKKSIVPKFFIAFTQTPDYAMQIKTKLSGSTRLRISRSNLGKVQVPLPDLDKQNQFVAIYKQADKSGFELKKSIEAIDAVIKSLINNY